MPARLSSIRARINLLIRQGVKIVAKGYWVSVYEEVMDQSKLDAYAKLAGPAAGKGGGKPLVRGGECVAKEGLPASRTVIIEFDSFEAAKATYDSPEYKEALATLSGGVRRNFRIVEGM